MKRCGLFLIKVNITENVLRPPDGQQIKVSGEISSEDFLSSCSDKFSKFLSKYRSISATRLMLISLETFTKKY